MAMRFRKILDYHAVQPRSKANRTTATRIPQSPNRLTLMLPMHITSTSSNKVELIATVGVRGLTGISQILFRIFRDGREIYNAVQGVESTGSEQNYIVTFQAIDFNVTIGTHQYTLTAENIQENTTAEVIGPVSFSALAISNSSS